MSQIVLPPREQLIELAWAHPVAWAVLASGIETYRDRRTGEIVRRPRWRPAKHLVWLAQNYLLPMERGEIRRLLVTLPPRHGKSTLISSYFTAWWLGRNPTHRAAVVSYGVDLAKGFGQLSRDAIAEHGEDVFGATTWARAKATDWPVKVGGRNTGGGMLSLGREGAFTGKGANLLIGDDLIKGPEEANSPTIRDKTWSWWEAVPMTRLEPDAAVLLVMTRWHHDDVAARALESATAEEPWTVVNLPCIANSADDLMGRAIGEVLWPERWDKTWALRKRGGMSPYVWESLYQGCPTPTEGAMFLEEWLRYAKIRDHHLEADGRTVLLTDLVMFGCADLAVSSKSYADYSAFGVFGMDPDNGDLYVLHMERGRLNAPEILKRMRALVDRWKLGALYVEYTAFNLQLVELAMSQGIPVRWVKADKDKVSRARPATAVFEHGRVFLTAGAQWLPMFIQDLLRFPAIKNDDLVDVLAYAVRIFLEHLEAWHDADEGE